MSGYDSDQYDNNEHSEDDDGWGEYYGLNYHDAYKARYGDSPWEGNNDDD
jgi:hypothetical protein